MVQGLVSIVVPAYFSERYLDPCLASIVSQDYPSLEVIVVDGSSEDRTPEIIRKYEEKYDFVRSRRVENKGVSYSRNCGIAMARGEYLEFVDSDDFLMPGACRTLVDAMEESGADMVVAGYVALKNGEKKEPVKAYFTTPDEMAKSFGVYFHYKNNCLNVPWNKLYRRKNLEAEFPEDLSMGEDLLFNLAALDRVSGIAFIPDVVYEYNNRSDQSLAYRYREDGFEIETMLFWKVDDFLKRHGVEDREVLWRNYLFGIKAKLTALIHRSGHSGRECRKRIRRWTGEGAVQLLTGQRALFGKKDRILLSLLRGQRAACLYWYYKIMAK